jgi:hypothetical protein
MCAEVHQRAQRIVRELRQLHSAHLKPQAECRLIIASVSVLHNSISAMPRITTQDCGNYLVT